MRSTLLVGCLLWAAVCVNSMTRVEHPSSIQKRAASPQTFTTPQNNAFNNTNQAQFQWVKIDNQWVRRDGTKLPGYSQANVPYNQSANRNAVSTQPSVVNTSQRPANQPVPGGRPVQQPPQQSTHQTSQQSSQSPTQQNPPNRQNSASQGGLGWNPDADRALTQDLPKTTSHPVAAATTQRPLGPQTPAPAHKPATPPVQPPFGSGSGSYQKQPPKNRQYNPDASLTYGLQSGQTTPPHRGNTTPIPNVGRSGTNPWGGLFNR